MCIRFLPENNNPVNQCTNAMLSAGLVIGGTAGLVCAVAKGVLATSGSSLLGKVVIGATVGIGLAGVVTAGLFYCIVTSAFQNRRY